ncbi:hypothetical protein [Macrococcus equipercicus]|uniref:Uncharacterized protein n=1 Tax=Macrococcus equipercicus TaxID=69967 RepID=A0A9Q9BN56_9STAP|nr:hypothetical protein [Macrococcus equipercicus]UTH14613.1 hypothetical protein KFV11_04450 [Macrococcus equipercicus]
MSHKNIKILVMFIYVLMLFFCRYAFELLDDAVTMLLLIIGLIIMLLLNNRRKRS